MYSSDRKRRTLSMLLSIFMMTVSTSLAQPASAQVPVPPPAEGIYIGWTSPWRGAPGMEVHVYGGGATHNGSVVVLWTVHLEILP